MKNNAKIGVIAGMVSALLALCITFVVAGTSTPTAGNGKETVLQVSNLSCGACSKYIESELRKHKGMEGMSTDIANGLITIKHTADLTPEQLAGLVSAAGYPAKLAPTAASTGQNETAAKPGCKGCNPKDNDVKKCNIKNCDVKNCDTKNCDKKNCDGKNCNQKGDKNGCNKKGCRLPAPEKS